MPAALNDVVKAIEDIAPLSLAYEWDNSGLLLRCGDNVNRVLIALDVTDGVAREAEEKRCNMILSHHPPLFEAKKRFDCRNTADAVMMRLIRAGINLYSAHTTFDRTEGGINDALAQRLGLENVEVLTGSGEGLVRTGFLKKPLSAINLADCVKDALGVETLKISQTDIDLIEKIAVVGGSGGNFITVAKMAGAQALITGEAKHHHFLDAQAQRVLLIEAGHFDTERCFVEEVFMSLQSRLNELQLSVDLYKTNSGQSPYKYI
jgi:dinuclear metal center YbgI/SA1388 family protein